jgi:hypothetical protein
MEINLALKINELQRVVNYKTKNSHFRLQKHFLIFALDMGEQSASQFSHYIPEQRVPTTHWREDWVGPKKNSTYSGKDKTPCPYWD